ncbi:MAG: acyl carrier protein [Myxococcales bacterium]|nr:acyl carrier protein [Myxococcales bacterium]
MMDHDAIFNTLRDVLREFEGAENGNRRIDPALSLVDDLGLTSLQMVDLTLALEDAFDLDEFPMQDWVEQETQRGEEGFSVASLVDACAELLSA